MKAEKMDTENIKTENAKTEKVKIEEVMALVRETKQFVENRDMAEHIRVKGPADYVTQVDTQIQGFLEEKLQQSGSRRGISR